MTHLLQGQSQHEDNLIVISTGAYIFSTDITNSGLAWVTLAVEVVRVLPIMVVRAVLLKAMKYIITDLDFIQRQ